MLAVVLTDVGKVEVNYLWLPTWIGMNAALLRELDEQVGVKWVGREVTNESLLAMHVEVVQYLTEKFKLLGLGQYLDGIKYLDETRSP